MCEDSVKIDRQWGKRLDEEEKRTENRGKRTEEREQKKKEKRFDVDFLLENFAMILFGRGKRMCPAYSLGVANLELALANLLYSFNWELPPGVSKEDIDNNVFPSIVMHKKNTLYLVANKY
ncbi:cytochrome P450 83B1-like [Chenopodium quinoa]|uniref:cytochrome P450 83B1-like n=1 Tax=Chenopodium quinoa TaxID=63459 RepID=UPI000B77C35A|nr:cytochrome P450 83B1-like [Chenopodium quinoa]